MVCCVWLGSGPYIFDTNTNVDIYNNVETCIGCFHGRARSIGATIHENLGANNISERETFSIEKKNPCPCFFYREGMGRCGNLLLIYRP